MLTEAGGRGISQGRRLSALNRKGKNLASVSDSKFWLRPFKNRASYTVPTSSRTSSRGLDVRLRRARARHVHVDMALRRPVHGVQEQRGKVRLLMDLP